MIEDLKWDTLEMRRRRFRLTLMYKLTHGPIDIDSQKYFIQHSESHMRGSHQFKFNVPYANKDIFKFSFSENCGWLELPPRGHCIIKFISQSLLNLIYQIVFLISKRYIVLFI